MFKDLLGKLELGKIHSLRFLYTLESESNVKYMRIVTGSVEELEKFAEEIEEIAVECCAEYLYSIDLEYALKFYIVKQKEKED